MKNIIIFIVVCLGVRMSIAYLFKDEYITNMFTLVGVAGWICDRIDSYLLKQEATQ